MERTEAIQVLLRLTAAYPAVDLPDSTTEVWIDHLADKRLDIALTVAKGIEETCRFFPSIAEFTDAYRVTVHQEAARRADRTGLMAPAGEAMSPEQAKKLIEGLRDKLADVKRMSV